MSFSRRSRSSAPFLTDNSESAASCVRLCKFLWACGEVQRAHFAQSVKDLVKVHEDFALRDFGDIVQTFSGEVPNSVLRVNEAVEEGMYKFLHIWGNVNPKSYRSCGESDESSVPNMKRIRGVVEHLHKLVNNLADPALVTLLVTFSDLSGCCIIRVII